MGILDTMVGMNTMQLDPFYNVCLFLDAASLANLSAVDKKRYALLQDTVSWPASDLKPHQAITSKDKIAGCLQRFLESLTIDRPSRFFVTSANNEIQLRIYAFCSQGSPILGLYEFNPNWRAPNEHEPSDTGANEHQQRAVTYTHPQRPELNVAWGEYCDIRFSSPHHFTTIGANKNFVTFLQQSVQQRIDQLKANEERRLIQNLEKLPVDKQGPFITRHNANVIDFETLQDHVEQGARLAQGSPLRNNRSNVCTQTALRVAIAVAMMSILIDLNFR